MDDGLRWFELRARLTDAQNDALRVLVDETVASNDVRHLQALTTLRAMPRDVLSEVLALIRALYEGRQVHD